jgi:hypothetical protein
MPDLSFFPESHLVEEAATNPVGFGQSHKADIARLVDIANLATRPFLEAEKALNDALRSPNPWERYWALVVCSCFGDDAQQFVGLAKEMAAHDATLLVRTRAAEFLGLIGAADPEPVMREILAQCRNGVEASLILNSMVVLRDGEPGYRFAITSDHIDPSIRNFDSVLRRLEYLGLSETR